MFLKFNALFFDGKLDSVTVSWSSRMTLCAGLCKYERRGGLCQIKLSEPLLKFRPVSDMINTLLHEMIHAFLFITHNNRDHDDHGPEFHKHMDRINSTASTSITVYHNFTDEVAFYRKHWWQCEKCKNIIKRAMNRKPGPYDFWWSKHQQTCGGTYIKIKEPEEQKEKEKKSKKQKIAKTESSQPTMNSFFLNKATNATTTPTTTTTTTSTSPSSLSVLKIPNSTNSKKDINQNLKTTGTPKQNPKIVVEYSSTESKGNGNNVVIIEDFKRQLLNYQTNKHQEWFERKGNG